MINALTVLSHIQQYWDIFPTTHPQDADSKDKRYIHTLFDAVQFMMKSTSDEWKALKHESAKLGHLRQLFNVWKAVCARLPKYEFYNDKYDAVRCFPLFFENTMPEVYLLMYRKNLFLGVQFSEEAKERITEIEKGLMTKVAAEEEKKFEKDFFNLFFGKMASPT